VYAIASSDNMIKIGYAKDIAGRLAELQVGNPSRLFLVSYIGCTTRQQCDEVENSLHESLEEFRVSGEWFCVGQAAASEALRAEAESRSLRFRCFL
jgi:hypothetical protein